MKPLTVTWILVLTLIGCETLKVLKEEAAAVKKESAGILDSLGSDLVRTYAAKVRKEIKRSRENLSYKVKLKIYELAVKNGIKTSKPFSPAEKREIMARVKLREKTPEMQAIIAPERAKEGRVYMNTPTGQWKPSKATVESFWKRNKKARQVSPAQQLLWMAMWEAKFDFLIFTGHRTCAEQRRLYEEGKSKIKSCTGQHNLNPAQAVDFVNMNGGKALFDDRLGLGTTAISSRSVWCSLKKQYPRYAHLNWRWGGDWRGTNRQKKNSFDDLYHIELRPDTKDTCLDRFL